MGEASHEKIFPKCSCIIHHGGAGTSASVLSSGVPSIIVPVLLWTDQRLWAQRLEDLGTGVYVKRCMEESSPNFENAKKLYIENVSKAFKQCLHPEQGKLM